MNIFAHSSKIVFLLAIWLAYVSASQVQDITKPDIMVVLESDDASLEEVTHASGTNEINPKNSPTPFYKRKKVLYGLLAAGAIALITGGTAAGIVASQNRGVAPGSSGTPFPPQQTPGVPTDPTVIVDGNPNGENPSADAGTTSNPAGDKTAGNPKVDCPNNGKDNQGCFNNGDRNVGDRNNGNGNIGNGNNGNSNVGDNNSGDNHRGSNIQSKK